MKSGQTGYGSKGRDIIQIRFGENIRRYEVISVKEHVSKGEATGMYREL